MANSFYQTPTTPRLYVSYPLWQYASGGLDTYASNFGLSNSDIIKLIQLDPSKTTTLPDLPYDGYENRLFYRIQPAGDTSDTVETNLWNFNYLMMLGHNFDSAHANVKTYFGSDQDPTGTLVGGETIVNWGTYGSGVEYDGFTVAKISDYIIDGTQNIFSLGFSSYSPQFDELVRLGSILFGKYFDFPQNCNLSTSLTYDYGVKQKQTVGGKTISTANWTQPNNWITEPFGLTSPDSEPLNNWQRRSGRRTWKISFDSLQPQYVMNQNPMLNSNGWDSNFDNYTTQADGTTSEYNINDAPDFFTNVVHRTMGGHLPMVLQINKDDNSPHNFAIVRMDKNYTVTQKSPNLYNIKLTLTEQI